jgi:hypothetical protein
MNHQIYLVYNKWTIIKLAKAKRHPVDQTQVSSAAQKNLCTISRPQQK